VSVAPNAPVAPLATPTPVVGAGARGVPRGVLHSTLLGGRLATAATAVLGLLIVAAILGPVIWGKDPTSIDVANALQAPSASHPMGTDANGRDVLARFLSGARLSLAVAPAVVIIGALIGGLLGVLAGVTGGIVDAVIGRVMDAILAFPPLILAMAVTVGLGTGVVTAGVGITLTSIPWYARLLRSDALRVRHRPFIEAAQALGATRRRVVLRHVVPHVMPTLLVQAASVFGYAILTLAALGFVGLGAQPPTSEWGSMITDGLSYTLTGQWWIGVFPGLGVFLAVTAANILADRAGEVLDPRSREN
jgi:peptide/nickel transport system permease protein